ncbi:MAG: FAD:protein FMN transferase [Planctomycetota bacterium]
MSDFDPATLSVVLACEAMATRFEFVLCGHEPPLLHAAGEAAIEEIEDTHRRLSAYDPASVVSAINRAAGAFPVRVDSELLEMLEICNAVHRISGGVFAPAIGGVLLIDHHASTAMLSEPSARLDLGGIGKGFGIDRAAAALRDAGVASALIHGGTSTTLAIGVRPDAKPWRIAVPSEDGSGLTISLSDMALSRSDRIEGSSRGHAHIVDPRTSQPARGALAAVVVHESAAFADAWSTAVVVTGSAPGGIAWGSLMASGWTLSDTLCNMTDPQET